MTKNSPVAIIGAAVRLPKSESLDEFWDHLAAGRSLISKVPSKRWDASALYGNPSTGQKTNSIWGGFVDDADCFDADFFQISPREAAWMDPQQRFALELAWRAVEDAGYRASALAGSRTGVYMGACHWDYAELLEKKLAHVDAYLPTGIAFSIIANRVSHYFDFRGPSITNDTACAASLVSVYEAVRALQNGECEQALAGGVNLAWSPNHFIAFSKSGMLSRDGQSKAFDGRADGYVRGEGGAMVLLKPLEAALTTGDPIYGVIRAIGTNHGGRTNSLTVTNPKAQALLIAEVYREAGVAPGSVSYIEAHGPGTPLGDPIEISGLKEAFRTLSAENGEILEAGSCGVGSVKTNIGHLEGAAGIAGLIKVLAALRHESIPANVGFTELNPAIDLHGSPFRIQSQHTQWPYFVGTRRRAGVSSFGFGGTNAHLLVEDVETPGMAPVPSVPVCIPLSAKDNVRLRIYAQRLLRFVEHPTEGTIADLAFTFQTGRDSFPARVAFVASDYSSLAEALHAYLADRPDQRVCLPSDGARTAGWLSGLVDIWVAGEEVTWPVVDGARRIHAPGQPFVRQRYWIDESIGAKDPDSILHPLLHRNVSRWDQQQYISRFQGREFFWADHLVNGKRLLPGVAVFEMLRAAYVEASGADWAGISISNVVWTRPIQAEDDPVETRVQLRSRGGADFAFDVTSGGVSHVQGTIEAPSGAGPDRIPLAALRAEAAEAAPVSECYERLRNSGMEHGPDFRAMTSVRRGEAFVLVQVKLSRHLVVTLESCLMHPILLDAAVQAWVALDQAERSPKSPAVPFACRRFSAYRSCEPTMWAYVRRSGEWLADGGLRRLDIDLCSSDGVVCASFRDLALRVKAPDAGGDGVVTAAGSWAVPADERVFENVQSSLYVAGFDQSIASALQADRLPLGDGFPASLAGDWFGRVQSRIIDWIRSGLRQRKQLLIVVSATVPRYLTAPLAALLKTAAMEQPKIDGAVVTMNGGHNTAQIKKLLEEERQYEGAGREVRYTAGGQRLVWKMAARELPNPTPIKLHSDGVYWVTGGLGGLGLLFAERLIALGARHIVLSGRGQGSEQARKTVNRIRESGIGVYNLPCDIGRREAVQEIVRRIDQEIGPLRGIIHAAGVIRDGYLFHKTTEDAEAVFAPKVAGTWHIDEATREAELDFLLLCTSIAGVWGNAGQADYAAANAFMDAFTEYRTALCTRGERRGATIAVAWPLWANGGMQVDASGAEALRHRFGTSPLPDSAGLDVLARVLAIGTPGHLSVYYGERARIEGLLRPQTEQTAQRAEASQSEDEELIARTVDYLKSLLAESIRRDVSEIRSNRKLEEYGLDSIVIVEMTNRLEEALGPLSKTLFFEHVNLDGVASALVDEHGSALASMLGLSQGALVPEPSASTPTPSAADSAVSKERGRHDVAIVGLSLRVAKAANQKEFWDMLSHGEHGFEPYPRSRWDHAALLHPERDVPGKSVVRTGAFLKDMECFDPRYFRISQREAELMSPEVRLFLEASVEAFEDAGYSREYLQVKYGGDIAVITGSMTNEYDYFGLQNMLVRGSAASGSYTGTLPNMVSYFYGFTGPSYFLDTMCSGAATCVHEAIHMLRTGRTRMALAGGVNLLLHPHKLIAASQEHFTTKSADVIRGYGLGADGTILGEGVGALVLKTLADAELDGDHIYAVIRGTAVSNAGVRNGFTVPNPKQQAAAIEQALADAEVDPRTIGYVEGHGSGTELGDPIEIKALMQAYRKYTSDVQFCPIGTVKSNVAHLLGAAALPGIVKVLMQMANRQLAPSLHAETLNPNIPFGSTPFYVQRELAEWRRVQDDEGRSLPLRAAVTSIGAGGMNAHLILEEYPAKNPRAEVKRAELYVFSAMTTAQLVTVVQRFQTHLLEHDGLYLCDVAYTLQTGKNELPSRLALVADTREELLGILDRFLAEPGPGGAWHFTRSILDAETLVKGSELEAALRARQLHRAAEFWVQGVSIDWDRLNEGRNGRRVSLPAYPFERIYCWYPEYADAPSVIHPLGPKSKMHPLVGANRSDLQGIRYSTRIETGELMDYLYCKGAARVLAPTALIEAMLAAARLAGLSDRICLREVEINEAPDWNSVSEIAFELAPTAGNVRVRMETLRTEGERILLATALAQPQVAVIGQQRSLSKLRANGQLLERRKIYEKLLSAEFQFKPYLEVIEKAWLDDGTVLCAMRKEYPQQYESPQGAVIAPGTLAGAWQTILLASPEPSRVAMGQVDAVHVPSGSVNYLLFDGRDLQFLDDDGKVLGSLEGMELLGLQAGIRTTTKNEDRGSDETDRILRETAAEILKFPAEQLDMRTPFYEFGFDSISLTKFAATLNARLGSAITPATLFECENLQALRRLVAPGAAASSSPALEDRERLPMAHKGIAIIGMAARLPGASNIDAFFQKVLHGDDLVGSFPYDRYGGPYLERLRSAGFPKHGGFLTDVDSFDAALFRVSPLEAERMDPQHRLLLETTWRALEDAGYRPDELPRDLGVFVGITGRDYSSLLQAYGVEYDGFCATGNSLAMAPNRISHFLDVRGPSQAVDTACSSSLVALLRAQEAIRSGQCSAALVAGVNLTLSIEGFEGPQQAGMLSPDGRCKAFARNANGYVRGEGVVVVLLKPFADAVRDGDTVHGLMIGGAENHGGRAGSLTAPNPKAQAELIRRAMTGIDPSTIGYIETHGTGTNLGDPVEINGLRLAYAELIGEGAADARIGLGSVKSNIGHLEAAAGLAGVVKVLCSMRARELPPTLHCEEVNPYIDLAGSPFYLVRNRQTWDVDGKTPRRAAVSSFGFGGTNTHVVLEECPPEWARSGRKALPPRPFAKTRFWIPGSTCASKTMIWTHGWEEKSISRESRTNAAYAIFSCGVPLPHMAGVRVVMLASSEEDIGARYEDAAIQLLGLLQSCGAGRAVLQVVVPLGDERGTMEGLGAMLDTAELEYPELRCQLIAIGTGMAASTIRDVLLAEAESMSDRRVRYASGRRWVRAWTEVPAEKEPPRWHGGGTYLITGGMGALGRLVAMDIAKQSAGSLLVLAGSSDLNDERRGFLAELEALGVDAEYRKVDCADAPAVTALVHQVALSHGRLHTIIHCAGVHRDRAIARKEAEEFRTVLRPKVSGATALWRACQELGTVRLILFSSLGGSFGNAGQVDYAAANGFLSSLAEYAGSGVVAIDWPLWRDGGMTVDADGERVFFERMGQRPLETAQGLNALRIAVGAGASHLAVIAGEENQIRAFLSGASSTSAAPKPANSLSTDPLLVDRLAERLRAVFARITGIASRQIELREPLENYGIDSLLITKLNRELGETFGSLPKTLFFEHRTLESVAQRLVSEQASASSKWAGSAVSSIPLSVTRVSSALAPNPQRVDRSEPIAIIGLSGRYPGAATLDQFWENLAGSQDAVREIPVDRWAVEGFYEEDPERAVEEGKSYSKWGAFLDGFAHFDPLFFRIAPRDAAAMDPQERLFLQACWHACEDAGYTRERLAEQHGSRVGVFVGITKTGFALYPPFRTPQGSLVRPGTSFSGAANRVSHVLNLNGPSMPLDTMCSSSLAAIHEACEQLRRGDCELALAGGVNLYLHPSNYIELCASRMLSPDGRCRSFGAGANGFVPGEGVGCVLLKPLSAAIADGDSIYAIVKGSAINHGGNTNGYTVPNPIAQRDVIRRALAMADVSADAVTYIEAHGTGTELGDPIEVAGLSHAFRMDTSQRGYCSLGSVKSNIGHTEAAAGIAGLTKILLQMKHRQLVPTLHVADINPNIDLENTPFFLQRQRSEWKPNESGSRIAGVSSFGAGGTNVHLIVESWPTPHHASVARTRPESVLTLPFVFSARDRAGLNSLVTNFIEHLQRGGEDTGGVRPRERFANLVRDIAGAQMNIPAPDVDLDDRFEMYKFGMPERLELRNRLERQLGIRIASAAFLSMSCLREVISFLASELPAGEAVESTDAFALGDVSYSLMVGREAMEERIAVEADSTADLIEALRAWQGGGEATGLYSGNASAHREVLRPLAADSSFRETVSRWTSEGMLSKVLDLWVKGLDISWLAIAKQHFPGGRVISLPGYPFRGDRYWVPIDIRGAIAGAMSGDGDQRLLAQQQQLETHIAEVLCEQMRTIDADRLLTSYLRWSDAVPHLIAAVSSQSEPMDAWGRWESYKQGTTERSQIDLAEKTLRALPAILYGETPATSVMFPAGGVDLVERVYTENAIAAHFNGSLADAVRACVENRLAENPAARLRILEIGAGTGSATRAVLDSIASLTGSVEEYRFTDISRAFLIRAEQKYGSSMPFFVTSIYDAEKCPADQGLDARRYDFVIAANVLHATRDIGSALANIRLLVRDGGCLLLNETCLPTLFTHVTFGLLDGWWRFVDGERRIPGTPSLTADSWREALEKSGFEWLGCSSKEARLLGQQIIAASARAQEMPRARLTTTRQAPKNRPAESLRDLLIQLVGETLQMQPHTIDVQRPFADYGLDSILGVELTHKINRSLGVALNVTRLFDFATVSQLERFLSAQPNPTRSALPVVEVQRIADDAEPRETGLREPIAIVGMSGRFARSENVDDLWGHLVAGRDLVERISRFDLSAHYKDAPSDSYCQHGSYITGIDLFDPVFFGISGIEATYMDPQQRLFLEESWKALENAGHAGVSMEGRKCGVFVGCSAGDYHELFHAEPPGQAFWGNTSSLVPARIAYYLDLKGPAIAVDTACSSSLVAIHLACQSLWAGESEMAIAGGVFIECTPRFHLYANRASMLSPSGHCSAFGEWADGIVPGEAVGAVILRPLRAAQADGDHILGVIVASGVNQDGTTNGITAPSAASQERLIREVYEAANLDPATITLMEAHGTGTILGDPIEHAALARVYGDSTDRAHLCALGSVKSNLGHATTAAGVVGLIKILLALRHQTIPPTLHAGAGNPGIEWDRSPFFL
ncbi:MAG TPA: SDR family NAD(P)-dependent oxidoreductase, partial [Bryobacteraceae bacterium]|nr:SDR family NAD(P)-dependent oxidoreductase [Bryobacteraceae bacterium]